MKLMMKHSRLWMAALAVVLLAALAGCAPQAGQAEPTPAQTEALAGAQTTPQAAQAYPEATALPQPTAYPGAASAPTAPQTAPYPYPADGRPTPAGDAGPKPAPAQDLPADAVLRLITSGGIAGIAETRTLYADGRMEVSRRAGAEPEPAGQLSPEQVARLLNELERQGFFEMQPEYGPLDACCDMIQVTLQARSGDKVHSVTYLQGQENTPAQLLAVLEAVQAALKDQ